MNIKTYLRLRPLEQKHKLKEDYFFLKTTNEEEKTPAGKTIKSTS